jgi:hypothetical protein
MCVHEDKGLGIKVGRYLSTPSTNKKALPPSISGLSQAELMTTPSEEGRMKHFRVTDTLVAWNYSTLDSTAERGQEVVKDYTGRLLVKKLFLDGSARVQRKFEIDDLRLYRLLTSVKSIQQLFLKHQNHRLEERMKPSIISFEGSPLYLDP